MSTKKYYKELADAIVEMVKQNQNKIVQSTSQSDIYNMLKDSISMNADSILNSNPVFEKSLTEQLVNGMIEKLEAEKKQEKELFEAALIQIKIKICSLFREIDEFVLSQKVNENMKVINSILDELIPNIDNRNKLIELIQAEKN